jgi:hypothetical protein
MSIALHRVFAEGTERTIQLGSRDKSSTARGLSAGAGRERANRPTFDRDLLSASGRCPASA